MSATFAVQSLGVGANSALSGLGGVSVIVCSRNRPEMLDNCLAAISAAMGPRDELVVVDSASRDAQTWQVAERYTDRVLRCGRPGLSRARNAGLRMASRSIVAFTDDDCRPATDWLRALQNCFTDPQVSFVLGRVTAESAPGSAPASVHDVTEARVIDASVRLESVGHGANMAFRRAALVGIGGFDEELGTGSRLHAGEDKDAIWRLLTAGCCGRYEPDAAVTHVQWRGRAAAVKLAYGYGQGWGALAAKARRADRDAGERLLRRGIGSAGLGQAWRDLRAGYQTGVLVSGSWTAGVLIGAWRGHRMPVRDGRYVSSPIHNDLKATLP
jgi:glycosyltransferase involved in cell wall biosynthesis